MKDFTFNIILKQNGVMQRFETNANEKVYYLLNGFFHHAKKSEGDYIFISQIDLSDYPEINYKKFKFQVENGKIIKYINKEKIKFDNL